MNPENNGGVQNQTPPQTPSAPGQGPTPQVYGPQLYSPFPAPGTNTPQPPQQNKNTKRLIIAIVVLLIVTIVVVAVAVLMNLSGSNGTEDAPEITRSYDSPVGLLPAFQSQAVKSGKFTLRASYITGGDFTRQGTYVVDEEGHMRFEMITDDATVNKLMSSLYTRGTKKPFDAKTVGATRNLAYDFASMMGYHYLYDVNAGPNSGMIPEVEAAKNAVSPAKTYTLTTACDTALTDVKKQTDISTTSVVFERRQEGVDRTVATMSFASRQAIDKSIATFLESCYDQTLPANKPLVMMAAKLREDITAAPTFTYGERDGKLFLEVGAPSQDTPFGGMLHFDLEQPSTTEATTTGEVASYVEQRNRFGLTYSLCRIDPVVTQRNVQTYRYLREDQAYTYPSSSDTGYYCLTSAVPSQFTPISTLRIKNTTGKVVTVTGNGAKGLQAFHDLGYHVEQYNLDNERYPGPTEFRDLATGGSGETVAVVQSSLNDKTLVYTPLPNACVGTCKDYTLSYEPVPNAQVSRSSYTK